MKDEGGVVGALDVGRMRVAELRRPGEVEEVEVELLAGCFRCDCRGWCRGLRLWCACRGRLFLRLRRVGAAAAEGEGEKSIRDREGEFHDRSSESGGPPVMVQRPGVWGRGA